MEIIFVNIFVFCLCVELCTQMKYLYLLSSIQVCANSVFKFAEVDNANAPHLPQHVNYSAEFHIKDKLYFLASSLEDSPMVSCFHFYILKS